jgi:signal transduction histidine kinase
VAREIVAAHGGTIAADSSAGQGTTITIRLPRWSGGPDGG